MFIARDGAFDEGHIHIAREFLHIRDGRVDKFDLVRQVDEAFIEVQERHVATGAASEPYRCDFRFHV